MMWPFKAIADDLNDFRQRRICAYGAGEDESCDCKFGIDEKTNPGISEKTGCPELRQVVKAYREEWKRFSVRLAPTSSDSY